MPAWPGSSGIWLYRSPLLGDRSITTSCAAPGSRCHSTPFTALPDATRQREWTSCARCNRVSTRRAGRNGSPSSWWVMVQSEGPSTAFYFRLGGGGGRRRRFLRRITRRIMPVLRRRCRRGRAARQWSPGPGPEVGTHGQSPRWMRASPNRSVRWARAEVGAVIYRAVLRVCKERRRRWGQERACRAHLSELARAVCADRTGAFSPPPSPPAAWAAGRWIGWPPGGRPSLVDSSWSRDASRSCPDGMGRACRPGRGRMLGSWTYHVGSQVQRVARAPPSRPSQ